MFRLVFPLWSVQDALDQSSNRISATVQVIKSTPPDGHGDPPFPWQPERVFPSNKPLLLPPFFIRFYEAFFPLQMLTKRSPFLPPLIPPVLPSYVRGRVLTSVFSPPLIPVSLTTPPPCYMAPVPPLPPKGGEGQDIATILSFSPPRLIPSSVSALAIPAPFPAPS